MHRFAPFVAAAAALIPSATAQLSVVLPNGLATAEGSGNNNFPWGRGGAGILMQAIYDSSHFTAQGITYPIMIHGVRWRPNTGAGLASTNFPTPCSIRMSTSPVDWSAVTTTFANQRGANETLCFQGPVTFPAQAAAPGPTPFGINTPLTTPFLYDPNFGDLNIETDLPIQVGYLGGTPQLDVHTVVGQANASRVFWTTGYSGGYPGTVGTGFSLNHAVVIQLDYSPAPGLFASFTADVTSGASPLAVTFTSSSFTSDPGGITSYAWDFDGDSIVDSNVANPTFTYTGCGNFNVSLTITDASHPATTLTRTAYIRTDDLTANFTSAVVGAYTVQFTDTSTPSATAWAWDFDGDTIVDSTAQNPIWVYPNGNSYNVRLTATRSCKTSTKTATVVPTQQLTTNLAANNQIGTPTTLYFNLDVLNPNGVSINSLDSLSSALSTPFTVDAYLKIGTAAGFELNANPWTKVGTATGTSNPVAGAPSYAAFPLPLHIPAGSYGVALRFLGIPPRSVTLPALTTYANADLSLTAGSSSLSTGGAFSGTNLNTLRGWGGTLYYTTQNVTGTAGHGFFGPGCAGTLGVSHQTYSSRPVIGSTLSVDVDALLLGIGVMVIGTSNTISGFGPLPVDLGLLGAPGCPLRVSLDATETVLGAGNTATWNFPIPNDLALAGVLIFNQLAVFDPPANAFGFALGDAAGWVIGTN